MINKIVVEPSRLKSVASKIDTQCAEYEANWVNLLDKVEGLGAVWKGVDNLAYVEKVILFKDDFQKMTRLLHEYSEFLRRAANAYDKTQQDIKAKAASLKS